MINRISHSVKRFAWHQLRKAGYLVRRDDPMAYPDQVRLLGDQSARCIFDLGANVGVTVEKYLGLFPQATIHAFEPQPEMVTKLQTRFCENERVRIMAVAASHERGTLQFNINENADTSSVLASNMEHMPESYQSIQATKQVLCVDAVTIDEHCREHEIESIDILKMDIQGGEKSALIGAQNMLADQRIDVIYTEAFVHPFYSDQPLLGDLCVLLADHGYVMHNLYNFSFRSTNGRCCWLDAIFVSPKQRARSLDILNSDIR